MKQIKRCDPRVRRKCPDAGFCKGVFMEGSECDSLQSKLAEQVARREAQLIDVNVLCELLDVEYERKMKLVRKGETHLDTLAEGIMSMSVLLGTMPAVDAAPVVHGRWKKSNYHGFLCCSECKDVYIDKTWFGGGKWNYCPNCGAKMDGGTSR